VYITISRAVLAHIIIVIIIVVCTILVSVICLIESRARLILALDSIGKVALSEPLREVKVGTGL